MAINETPAGRCEAIVDSGDVAASRRPLFQAVRWGAVLAGVAVGISTQMLLTVLGIATGLAAMDVAQGDTIGTKPLIWAGISMLISSFLGGYVAARMSGLKRKSDGVLHGAVSWAVTTILLLVLATSIGGSLVSGVFNNMTQLAQGAVAGSTGSPLASLMKSAGVTADAETMRRLQAHLKAGERDQAIQLMTGSMGMERARAEQIVDQALIVSGSAQSASPQARASTDQALKNASKAAWGMFGALALALAIGIGGGALGSRGARRIAWPDKHTRQA